MQKISITTILLLSVMGTSFAQSRFSAKEFSINGFRSPSIGAEYRYQQVSLHAGYYLTAFKAGETTNFIKIGVTYWFAPVGKKENPSSFYTGTSYMRGLNRAYESKDAFGTELGFRWMIWQGLNIRIGAIAVTGAGETFKVNPAGGISYSFFFN